MSYTHGQGKEIRIFYYVLIKIINNLLLSVYTNFNLETIFTDYI